MMSTRQAYRIVFDAAKLEHGVEAWISAVLASVPWAGLIYERQVGQILTTDQLKQRAVSWPAWHTRPWIIVGAQSSPSASRAFCRPFVGRCLGREYDQQVQALLDHFDWAIFTYFTTYHDEIYTWVSRTPDTAPLVTAAQQQNAALGCYTDGALRLQSLKNATFYDAQAEGWLAYAHAIERGEDVPYLLCRFDLEQPALYWREGDELEGRIGTDWFEGHLAQLELVEQFECSSEVYGGVHRVQFRLYRATNEKAYCAVWAEASRDWAIAEASLSADCDVSALKVKLSRAPHFFDVVRDTNAVASWAYGQIYGGGSNEHHAVFHARDGAVTHEIWTSSADSGISRF